MRVPIMPVVAEIPIVLAALASNMPAGMWPLIALYAQVSWAMATFGYIFSLLSPANGTLLTAATTLILFAFFSGALIGPEMLPEALRCIFWINPGYSSFLQIGLGNAVKMPFSLTRWRLIQLFTQSKIIPEVKGSPLVRMRELALRGDELGERRARVVAGPMVRFRARRVRVRPTRRAQCATRRATRAPSLGMRTGGVALVRAGASSADSVHLSR